jgi:hypothetical protein
VPSAATIAKAVATDTSAATRVWAGGSALRSCFDPRRVAVMTIDHVLDSLGLCIPSIRSMMRVRSA